MRAVVKTVNFIRARGVNHRQFENLLSDEGVFHDLPHRFEATWLSRVLH